MMNERRLDELDSLIATLDAAVASHNTVAVTQQVKEGLMDLIHDGRISLPPRFHQSKPDHYSRRLLYRDPTLAYTAVVMTWGPGQGTWLHDHAGIWCVEAVIEGAMEVRRFDVSEQEGERYRFVERGLVHAGVGTAGCLIPPFEYHTLTNALQDRTSITLHVYGGEMDHCHVFEPRPEGWFERCLKDLKYDE